MMWNLVDHLHKGLKKIQCCHFTTSKFVSVLYNHSCWLSLEIESYLHSYYSDSFLYWTSFLLLESYLGVLVLDGFMKISKASLYLWLCCSYLSRINCILERYLSLFVIVLVSSILFCFIFCLDLASYIPAFMYDNKENKHLSKWKSFQLSLYTPYRRVLNVFISENAFRCYLAIYGSSLPSHNTILRKHKRYTVTHAKLHQDRDHGQDPPPFT